MTSARSSGSSATEVRYVSTRGDAPVLGFGDVLLEGLASDGGLYVPEHWPSLSPADLASFANLSYPEVAVRVLTPFVGGEIDGDEFERMVHAAYSTFDHPDVVPISSIGDLQLVELYRGPTYSFKDVALQLIGHLFEHELGRRSAQVTIVGATSGDTGSAAIEACRGRRGVELVMLHPQGRVTEIQRRQMTTVDASNIHNVAIDGTFDDCQDLVKAMFGNPSFRDRHRLAAVNSINWARVAAQTVYYVTTAVRLGAPARPVAITVPTGNFGNVLAGHIARMMGVPIERLTIASNHNDILTRTYETGVMTLEPVVPSTSPAMDIGVSSNFERLLYELQGRDGPALGRQMAAFRAAGALLLPDDVTSDLRRLFEAGRASELEVEAAIADVYRETGRLVDPHTAVGVSVARRAPRFEGASVVMATAHPAKFGEVVSRAVGHAPELPPGLAAVVDRPEFCVELPNDLAAVMDHVAAIGA